MRHTKILATLGPASADPEVLHAMLAAGVDGVRLNFSHGTREWHQSMVNLVRETSERLDHPVAILEDLQGPKIRVGKVKGGSMELVQGSQLVITTRELEGAAGVVSTEYEDLPRDVGRGEQILLDDGKIMLSVKEVKGEEIICVVETGGLLSSHKGINVPGATLRAHSLTEKDREDARFALELGVDYLALSFVRRARDVLDLRGLMKLEGKQVPIIAKIEKPQAIDNLDEIVAIADGVMVARGDLGVEVSLEMIPAYQKRIIQCANRAGKLVITATQMLESMTENPFPTRAEVTDVANAILDGTDVVMLSAETAVGRYPVEAVRRMSAIAQTTEETIYPFASPVSSIPTAAAVREGFFTPVLTRLAGFASREVDPKAIVVFTRHGRTARMLSYERPRAPVLAFTTEETILRRLALQWGVVPRRIGEMGSVADLLAAGERLLLEGRWARHDDTVLFLIGTSTSPGATNAVKIARVGDLERETSEPR
jgi:pyruvate kinase